ncbi:DNA binding HTH domain Psq-type [Trinorchestia longiramus]|nr:DNA binding HTH domain Psq-type [Trinorchestia longiramus]
MGPKKNVSDSGRVKRMNVRTMIELKKEIIAKFESGVRVTDLATQYGMAKSTISTFLKKKEELREENVAKGMTSLTKKRSQILEEVDKLLLIFINEKQLRGDSISKAFFCEKVLSGTSFLSAISHLRSLSSTALSDAPSQLQTSTPRSLPTSGSCASNSSLQSPSKNTKSFCCSSCSYRTDVYHNLKIHLRTHTGERPYACPLCPYRGTQLFHVQRHMRTHTGEKPYGCHLCPYKSNRKDHLTEHMLASHKVDYRTRSGGIN